MTFLYIFRLVCLCLASFFILQVASSLLVCNIASASIQFAHRLRPRAAARLLLSLRLLPAGISLVAVSVLCLPSYLLLEPHSGTERIGILCSLAALLAAALWATSLLRVLRASAASARCARNWKRTGKLFHLPEEVPDILVVEDDAPLLALAGVFRPQLVASRAVLQQLSPGQLNAALRHESAHHASRDNLKRLLLLLVPDALPFVRSFASLERAWSRFTEWAADDCAVAGDAHRSLFLAEALVRVSRMGASPRLSPFLSTLVPDDNDLSARVSRLLQPAQEPEKSRRHMQILAAGAVLAVAGLLTAVLLHPATFFTVHRLLEHLVR